MSPSSLVCHRCWVASTMSVFSKRAPVRSAKLRLTSSNSAILSGQPQFRRQAYRSLRSLRTDCPGWPFRPNGTLQLCDTLLGEVAMAKKLRITAILKIAGLTFGAAIGAYLATMIVALLLTTAVIFWVMEGERGLPVPSEDMQFALVTDTIGVVVASIVGIVGGVIGYRCGNRWWRFW